MPMDYDDNDISHHNLQLAGEARSRSPSALKPYDFPKFDFDDSLQGHLRFDSLVETEVFLGIQSQEDSPWIEDFSRGSNGMEFNSTPVDSCSISRRNNVWSEATSSESVEMLLKSVGQEEMMPGASVIHETVANPNQGTLSEVVASSSIKPKERNDALGTPSDTTIPQDEVLKNENNLCGNGGTLTDEGNNSYHAKLTQTSVEKSIDEGGSLSFPSITDHVDSAIGMLSTSNACEQVNSSVSHGNCIDDDQVKHVSSETVLVDAAILQGKTGVASFHTCSVGNSLGSVPDSGSESQEANLDSVDNLLKGEFELKSSQGDDSNMSVTTLIQNKRPENALAVTNEMDKPFDNHPQSGSSMDVIFQHSEHCASPKQLIDHTAQLPHKLDSDNMKDISVSPSECKSVSEMSSLSMETNETSKQTGECIDKTVLSSAANHVPSENSEGCLKDTIATGEDSVAHLLADDMNIPMQVSQDNFGHRQADLSESEKDMCGTTAAAKEMTCDIKNTDSKNVGTLKIDHKTPSLEVREGLNVDDTAIQKLMPQSSGKPESAKKGSTFSSIKASTASSGHLEVGQRATAATVLHSNNYQKENGMVGANLQAEVDDTSKVGVDVIDDTVRIPISEIPAMSQQPVDKVDNVVSSKEALDSQSLDCKKSSLDNNADLASGGETMAKVEEKDSGQTADIDKTSCGSPTIISSSEPSHPENDNQEEGRDYQITDKGKGEQSTSEVLKRVDSLGDDCGFTFKVNALPDTHDREPEKNWSPFPDVEKSKVLEETAPFGKSETENSQLHKTPRQNAKLIDGETGPGISKGTSERKGRRGSAKGTTKENFKKGNQSKSPNRKNASLKVENVSNSLLSPPSSTPTSHVHCGNAAATNKTPFGGVAISTSNLPDLNASAMSNSSTASSSSACRQPFSDLQQVQLRAQIFVYGSLIQGHVPDDDLMVSAFGQYEGGRNFWERTWRAAAERVENHKSSSAAAETPRSQSGARVSGAVKQGSHSSKLPATPMSRPNSKETSAAVLSPIVPLSSPLWNISTPRDSLTSSPIHKGNIMDFHQALAPVHPYQTPPIRNYVSHTSLSSQTSFPSPWLASPQTSSFSANVQVRPVTMTETVKLTPVKDTSAMLTSIGKHTTSSPALHVGSPSLALGGVSPIHDPKLIPSAVQHSVNSKPRKRKKVPASDPGQATFVFGAQTGSNVISDVASSKVISNVASPSIIPLGGSTPSVSDAMLNKPAADASTVSPFELLKKSDIDIVKGVACSEETLNKVVEAKSQADDAEALANAAVTHCEDLWGELTKQKVSGLTSETEARLASSAAAVAAAVSVAKAAASAARIACNAALQAKLIADNALQSGQNSGVIQSSGKSSRQAENLDAIVKASELAEAAVAQAGKIVAMGEPLTLSDLIKAGPEGYWKLAQPSAVLTEKVKNRDIDRSGAVSSDKASGRPAFIPSVDSVEKGGPGIIGKDYVHVKEAQDDLLNGLTSISGMSSKHTDEKDLRTGIDHEASDTSKSSRGGPEIETPLETSNINIDRDDMAGPAVDGIKEGSHVEVFNPRGAKKSAWYTAIVLSVEEGKAYVCYNDLLFEKGSGNVQDWVPLGSDGNKAPIVRTVHPLFALPSQQTRKRRRAALGDYNWCIGDRVDAWINDCWCEGVVTEKNEKDDTTLKVHLSAQGETQTVRAWHLRASRSWINGKWIEWSSKGQNTSELSDTPKEKRQKLGSLVVPKLKDKESNDLDSALEKPEQSKLLTLSTSERTFDIGKTTTINDKKHAARGPLRTNQQKEGSRVVFGVPKPTGKKRKFMEVSKHFSTNKTDKSNEPNDSVKFAKYLMPQGSSSRGWKVPTRNDSKDKRILESRPGVLSSRKAQRNLPQRENTRSKSAQNADTTISQGDHLENSVSIDDNTSDKSLDHGSGSFEESTEAPLSSLLPHSLSTVSKRIPSLNSKTDRLNRGRLGPSGEKLSKIEEEKVYSSNTAKSTLDVSEPRRSNRRIQPTHRLLEGFQSSMAIPKMPAVSDKSRRNLPARGK